jgi:hypothetical protein
MFHTPLKLGLQRSPFLSTSSTDFRGFPEQP